MITSMMCSTITKRDAGAMDVAHQIDRKLHLAPGSGRPWLHRAARPWARSQRRAVAISSRLRPGVPSERARRLGKPRHADAFQPRRGAFGLGLEAMPRCGRNAADHSTFSSTDIPSKVCGTWKVRASPSAGARAFRRQARDGPGPSKQYLDLMVDNRSPVRQLKKGGLGRRRFGPDQARGMSPCCSVTESAIDGLEAAESFW